MELAWWSLPRKEGEEEEGGNGADLQNRGRIKVDEGARRVLFEMEISVWLPRLVAKVVERLVLRRELKSLAKFAAEEIEEEERVRMLL
ncbi:hypothetical protein TrRE_jg4481 [Triparma retinervis]|uniref:Uncharacterized protein n=1 Tax=Triparma retinervis TaxID=2557542 RepID=A0A9W7AGW7_9STRA|nr:hypothetical protein TrRE_jg4481 [Triparma retinervis]